MILMTFWLSGSLAVGIAGLAWVARRLMMVRNLTLDRHFPPPVPGTVTHIGSGGVPVDEFDRYFPPDTAL